MLITIFNRSTMIRNPLSIHLLQLFPRNFSKKVLNSTEIDENYETKLINVLNNFDKWESYKHVLTEKKFNLIYNWMKENGGSIRKFNDILQIKGISKKTVEDLRNFCESQVKSLDPVNVAQYSNIENDSHVNSLINNDNFILYEEETVPIDLPSYEMNSEQSPSMTRFFDKKSKTLKLMLEPRLGKNTLVRSFTSLYHDVSGITCTTFSANDKWKIEDWKYHKLKLTGIKHIHQLCDKMSEVVDQLPSSDIYIMDDHISSQHFRKPIPLKRLAEFVQINQQLAILVALLQNRAIRTDGGLKQPNVFSINYSIVGRFYNLYVGREPISTQKIIKNILQNANEKSDENSDLMAIEINNDIKDMYYKSYPVEREFLGKSMLIGLTFIHLGLGTNKK